MKKVFFPFYKVFRCAAEHCPMNCCSLLHIPFFEWEANQMDTKPEWQDIDGEGHAFKEFTHRERNFLMCDHSSKGYCKLRNDNKLCSIQIRYGESAMPSVCRTYPRMITKFTDRVEYSLDPCCPIALYSLKTWNIGEFTVSDASCRFDSENQDIKDRNSVIEYFANTENTLKDCFRKMAAVYGSERIVPLPALSEKQTTFFRKASAFHFWSYVLAYEGYPGIDNVTDVLLQFFSEYAPTLPESSDDWEEMCRHYSASLIRFVQRIGFDFEIEGRYRDSSEDIR